jgi:D-alanyl-D-alanine carboxypeptidase
MVGRDVSRDTLSWARGAGGILSTTGDMTRWERPMYSGELLRAERPAELLSLSRPGRGSRSSAHHPLIRWAMAWGSPSSPSRGWGRSGSTRAALWLPDAARVRARVGADHGHGAEQRARGDQIDVLMTSVYSTLVEQGAVPAPATAVGAGA